MSSGGYARGRGGGGRGGGSRITQGMRVSIGASPGRGGGQLKNEYIDCPRHFLILLHICTLFVASFEDVEGGSANGVGGMREGGGRH